MLDKNKIHKNWNNLKNHIDQRLKKISADNQDIDEVDEFSMESIDTHSADYSNFGYIEKEIKLPIKPNLNKPETAPDEFKKNQDPQTTNEDITSGGNNSSANTTSTSAPKSSEAIMKPYFN